MDLTEFPGAESGDVVYLCRNVTLEGPLPNNQLPVGLAMSNGTLRWLPKNERFNEARPVAPNNRNWRLSGEAGEHQLVARLSTGRDAGRQFYFMPQPNAVEPGAGDGNRRIAHRRSLFEAVRREFTAVIDAAEIEIEQTSGFWDNRRELKDWPPGEADAFLASEYTAAIRKQLTALAEKIFAGRRHPRDAGDLDQRIPAAARSAACSSVTSGETVSGRGSRAVIQLGSQDSDDSPGRQRPARHVGQRIPDGGQAPGSTRSSGAANPRTPRAVPGPRRLRLARRTGRTGQGD